MQMNTRLPPTLPPRLALTGALACLALLAACSSIAPNNIALERARARLDTAQAKPQTVAMAADQLARAREAIHRADQALVQGDDMDRVNHLAYLAEQQVRIAEDMADSRNAQAAIAGAAAERNRLRLASRTQEADMAQSQRESAELASANKTTQLAQAEASAKLQRDHLARRNARVDDLESQLDEMNARYTDRGAVITLGDLLFDTGASALRSSGQHRLDQLAAFMKRQPQQHASIEGYTDSIGKASSNQVLSDQRAHAVMAALVLLGVPERQLSTHAFGEAHPVGPNTTPAGRQLNRRVEVVFSREVDGLVQK